MPLDVRSCFDRPRRDEIRRLRRRAVGAHRDLRLFPESYDPLKPPHTSIWSSIVSGAGWVPGVAYYVVNPYAAVIATRAAHATPLTWTCGGGELRWDAGRLTEVVHGGAAACWLDEVFSGDRPGCVRLVTVNAQDAGFSFAHVDTARCTNVDDVRPPDGIAHEVHRQRCLFHRGRRGLNNISPADPLARVMLERDNRDTTIVVKLWRGEPSSPQAPADLEYVIRVRPSVPHGLTLSEARSPTDG